MKNIRWTINAKVKNKLRSEPSYKIVASNLHSYTCEFIWGAVEREIFNLNQE